MEQQLIQKFADLHADEVMDLVSQQIEAGTDPRNIFQACQKVHP